MNIGDAYPKRKSATPAYGYNNELARNSLVETPEFSATFDYVMVFPMKDSDQTKVAKHCIHEMFNAGLELFPYLSVQDDELLVLIRCPVSHFHIL